MLKAAVVGVGNMGQNHARNYSAMKKVNLIAVCDIESTQGKKVAKIYKTKFYTNHKELIKNEHLDLVSVCVPTYLHKTISIDFIEKNIPTLIEKPLAVNTKEAKQIIKRAVKNKCIVLVGHTERFNPAVLKLQDIINKGKIGNILSLVIKRVGLLPLHVKDVSVVQDLAVHDLDITAALLGRLPYSVHARGGNVLLTNREDHAEIFLDYGGFGCFIQVNWITPTKIRNLSITGTKGHANLNYITQTLEFYKSNKYSKQPRNYVDFVRKYGEARKKRIVIKKGEPLKLELENFVKVVEGKAKLKVTLEEGLNAVKLSELVLESIRKGKVIKLIQK